MEYVQFSYNNGNYSHKNATSNEMDTLGLFLSDDVNCDSLSFKEYALNDWEIYTSSNATALEKKNGCIFMSDMYSQEEVPSILKMTREQFIKLLDDWQEKVCKSKPKEVIIKYENDEYTIETKD